MTVLDISQAALEAARTRLGERASQVQWIVADVTKWHSTQTFDLWHDRAAFHFLTDPADRSAYVTGMKQAVKPGGHVIIGTFATDGPEKCSGLPVNRYDEAGLAGELGEGFELTDLGDTTIRPPGIPHSVSCFFGEPPKAHEIWLNRHRA